MARNGTPREKVATSHFVLFPFFWPNGPTYLLCCKREKQQAHARQRAHPLAHSPSRATNSRRPPKCQHATPTGSNTSTCNQHLAARSSNSVKSTEASAQPPLQQTRQHAKGHPRQGWQEDPLCQVLQPWMYKG
eukprot:2904302-Rhodomonas_salina.2